MGHGFLIFSRVVKAVAFFDIVGERQGGTDQEEGKEEGLKDGFHHFITRKKASLLWLALFATVKEVLPNFLMVVPVPARFGYDG